MANLDIAQQRLLNQRLASAPFEKPVEAVSWLVAVQSQDYFGAKWALGLRLNDAHDADIDQAFNAGTILRTHVLRPTWHFVTPTDIRWLLTLTAPNVHAVNARRYRELELDDATLKRSHKALIKALQDGQHLQREELGEALEKAGVAEAKGQRLAYIVMHAELDGLICSGPRRGRQFTYALLDEHVPPTKALQRDEALIELARRYFVSRGPATVQDFAKWSGLPSADAKRGLAAVKDRLQHEALDGSDYWFPPSPSPARLASPTADLLSVYDEYITGYQDRSMIGKPEVIARLFTIGAALSYLVVIDGQIVGMWKRQLERSTVVITIDYWTRVTRAQMRAVTAAAQRYAEFLEKQVVIA